MSGSVRVSLGRRKLVSTVVLISLAGTLLARWLVTSAPIASLSTSTPPTCRRPRSVRAGRIAVRLARSAPVRLPAAARRGARAVRRSSPWTSPRFVVVPRLCRRESSARSRSSECATSAATRPWSSGRPAGTRFEMAQRHRRCLRLRPRSSGATATRAGRPGVALGVSLAAKLFLCAARSSGRPRRAECDGRGRRSRSAPALVLLSWAVIGFAGSDVVSRPARAGAIQPELLARRDRGVHSASIRSSGRVGDGARRRGAPARGRACSVDAATTPARSRARSARRSR